VEVPETTRVNFLPMLLLPTMLILVSHKYSSNFVRCLLWKKIYVYNRELSVCSNYKE